MRHYHAAVNTDQSVVVPVGTYNYTGLVKVYLDPLLDGDTPASQRVRNAFRKWCRCVKVSSDVHSLRNGYFFYSNLNTGVNVLFIARDSMSGDIPGWGSFPSRNWEEIPFNFGGTD